VTLFGKAHDARKVSVEEIAAEARVSPTTIYNYFGTREKLLYEVIKALVRESMERNSALIRSNAPFPQKLIGIISGKLDMMAQLNGEIITKMLSQDKTIAPFIDEIYESEIKPLWLEMLADGKKQGYIDPALDDEVLLIYLDALKAGFTTKAKLLQSFKDNTDLLKKLSHLMFYGFLKKDIDLFSREGK
jgi:AcrR family transcriptional regulator